jgi:hypothetical protein
MRSECKQKQSAGKNRAMKKPEGQNERNRVVGKYVYEVSVHELNAAAIICIADRFELFWDHAGEAAP